MIAAPEACAVKYDRVEEAAVTGPDYALPAAPYGAPAPAAASVQRYAETPRYEDDTPYQGPDPNARPAPRDTREAYNAPRRIARQQQNQDYYNQGWEYGPYGWVPPRPPRRFWYQSGYDD
jgi:hypothetical protein